MSIAASLNWGRIARAGVLAGIAGGLCFDAFLYLANLLPVHESILSLWQFVASTAFGKAAYSSVSYAWIGLAMHLCTSIAWGTGYAYVAATRPALNKQPIVAGLAFGLIVFVVMQFVLYMVQSLKFTTPLDAYLQVLAHIAFFGVPVALVVARTK